MNTKHKNILIAVDGSDSAKKAFNKAVQIAKKDGARLVLTHVVDTQYFSLIAPHLGDIHERSQVYAEELLDEHVQTANESGPLQIKKIIEFGSPKGIITKEVIPDENIDLVIVGATGVGDIERILMGSVSEYIVRHSSCDVLVVR